MGLHRCVGRDRALRGGARDFGHDDLVGRSIVVQVDGHAHLASVVEALFGGDLGPVNLDGQGDERSELRALKGVVLPVGG